MVEIDDDNDLNNTSEHEYNDCNGIHSVDVSNLSFNIFFRDYLVKNKPCIIKNISSDWECMHKWINREDKINYEYFENIYGDLEAPVADCSNIQYSSQCKESKKIKDYMSYLKSDRSEGLFYLKDWHLKKIRPNDNFYETPTIFLSDWLNEYAQDHDEDDFKFVYIGPAGSWTPFHADVYSSYSWSVNIVGCKKWTFLPPGEEEKVKDNFGNIPLLFNSEKQCNVKYFEIIQEKGDAIFVPSGWYHQVTNMQDTISINHNWINACNIAEVWRSLQNNMTAIELEIQDLKDTLDFTLQCENILKSLYGMDTNSFVAFVCYIATKRIALLEENQELYKKVPGRNLIKFDLIAIKTLLQLIQNESEYRLNANVKEELLQTERAIKNVELS